MEVILGAVSLEHSLHRKVAAIVFRGVSSLFTKAAIETLNEVSCV